MLKVSGLYAFAELNFFNQRDNCVSSLFLKNIHILASTYYEDDQQDLSPLLYDSKSSASQKGR